MTHRHEKHQAHQRLHQCTQNVSREARYTLTQAYTKECQSIKAIGIDCAEVYGDTIEKEKQKKQNTNYSLNSPVVVLTSFINSFCSITFKQ